MASGTDPGGAGTDAEEAAALLAGGAKAANRSGGFAFLAFLALAAAALYFYLADRGAEAFSARLDADLLAHAELSLAAAGKGSRLAVAPFWPLELYWTLRREMAFCAAAAALAALLWSLAARFRSRRDAWLVHEKLSAELAELRRRLDQAGIPGAGGGVDGDEKKG
ncbi:MAG: hypothetical protein LBU23_02565 [Planctomycetota bacterium]|jgi:hypothetical protein|nr:hypothetical protein [Planctomycetota bacterium]